MCFLIKQNSCTYLLNLINVVFFQVFDEDSDLVVVFFSPSGVQFALPVLKATCDFASLKVRRLVVL